MIIMHGAARNPSDGIFGKTIIDSLKVGMDVLGRGGSCLDAVEEAISLAEDTSVFNAGSGSHLNLEGEVEMDACIMDGKTLNSGAVAAIRKVKNPISVARKVMEETDHILLVGGGSMRFARVCGFKEYKPKNEQRLKEWKKLREILERGEQLPGINLPDSDKLRKWIGVRTYDSGTVGAVAIDKNGNIATGISSGGTPMKMPGRVGDVPLMGCSVYADNNVGGVSLSGTGNVMVRFFAAKTVCDLMEKGLSAQNATEAIFDILNRKVKKFVLGIVAVDRYGGVGAARNIDGMPHAYMADGMAKPKTNFAPILENVEEEE